MTKKIKPIHSYSEDLAEIFQDKPFPIFLCGPSIKDLSKNGASLRKRLKEALEKERFEVYLGEDDGLENLRKLYGADAQTNEIYFIERRCNAVILIASSVGAYCELGTFTHSIGKTASKIDFILLIDKAYENEISYLNEGPATIVKHSGLLVYADLDTYDVGSIIVRLKSRRAVYSMDTRGRPTTN